jgi:mRNA-degrading endonuclease toxin of MazEF toxin-antitoxin module
MSEAERTTRLADAVQHGRSLALVCDQSASPQERAAASIAMVTTGAAKVPAQVAAVAGRGANPTRVIRFLTDCAAGIRTLPHIDSAKARDYTGNVRKAVNKWAEEHYPGHVAKSDKGAGRTCYRWDKVETPAEGATGSTEAAPADVDQANADKAKAKAEREAQKAEQKGLKAGLAQAEKMAAEATAAMAAELAELRQKLADATAGEARALHLARHYASAARATGPQKATLTKAEKAAVAKAKAAAKAIGQTFTLPRQTGGSKKSKAA